MQITVKLFASFRYNRFKEACQDHPPGTDCLTVATALDLTEAEVGIILVNGCHAELSRQLQEGDTLSLFPLIGGG
jgi:sulfur-carrier protein